MEKERQKFSQTLDVKLEEAFRNERQKISDVLDEKLAALRDLAASID